MTDMEYIAICVLLYVILIFADIIPIIKKGQRKPLWFSIPVYLVTFVLNILVGLGVKIVSPGDIIVQFINTALKLK